MSGAELEDVDAEVTPCEVDEELVPDPPHELAIMITTTSSDPFSDFPVRPTLLPPSRHNSTGVLNRTGEREATTARRNPPVCTFRQEPIQPRRLWMVSRRLFELWLPRMCGPEYSWPHGRSGFQRPDHGAPTAL